MTLKFFVVYLRCFLKVLSNLIWQGPVADIWPENNFKLFCTLAFLHLSISPFFKFEVTFDLINKTNFSKMVIKLDQNWHKTANHTPRVLFERASMVIM